MLSLPEINAGLAHADGFGDFSDRQTAFGASVTKVASKALLTGQFDLQQLRYGCT